MKYVAVGTKYKSKGDKETTEIKMGETTMGIAHFEKSCFRCCDELFLFYFPSILSMLVVRGKVVVGMEKVMVMDMEKYNKDFYKTLQPAMCVGQSRTIGPSVHHTLPFRRFLVGFCIAAPAQMIGQPYHCFCPPTRDFGSRVSCFVF